MEKLIPSFKNSIFNDESKSLLVDLGEIGIDSVLDDGLFKDLPIVSTIIGVGKTAQRLQDRNFLKQTLLFIRTLNDQTIEPEKLNKYRLKITENPKFAEQELGRVLLILNSTIDDIKSVYLAKFYRAYILEKIDWELFSEFSDIISRLFTSDIECLIDIFKNKIDNASNRQKYKFQRLTSLGLINVDDNRADLNRYNVKFKEKINMTSLGNKFCDVILNT